VRQETDGSLFIRKPGGRECGIVPQGYGRGKLRSVASVMVADITCVTLHHINRVQSTVSHVVVFHNGGPLCYCVDANG
jgi:hypothetical protein